MAHHNFDEPYTQTEYLSAITADFTRRAPSYSTGKSGEEHTSMLSRLLEFYPPVAPVLDVACGTGLLSTIHHSPRDVIGIDLTPAMLHEARRAAPQSNFIVARAEALPFRNETFGSVFICAALPYFIYPDMALREAWRVLRPGGFLAYQAVTMDSYVAGVVLRQSLVDVLGKQEADTVFKLPHVMTDSKKDNERFLRQAGFVSVEAEMVVEETDMEVVDAEQWWYRFGNNALTKRLFLLEHSILERVRKMYIQLIEERRDVENILKDRICSWYVKGTKPR